MRKNIRKILIFMLTSVIVLTSLSASAEKQTAEIEYLQYPSEAFTEFKHDFLQRVSGAADYETNKGYTGTCLFISPYWNLTVDGKDIPVYATLSYDREIDGVLSSFQYIFVKDDQFSIDVKLTSSETLRNGICLPKYENVDVTVEGNELSATLDHFGIYTFLVNDDSQDTAITIFVRKYRDEGSEIAQYIQQYGEKNVKVYEKGYYTLDELSLDNKVTYFKRGSFIHANHLHDTESEADIYKVGHFMSLYGGEDVIITGMGTVDFNSLDWHERNHCTLNAGKNVTMEGMLFLNSSSWTLSAYGCEDCTIRDIAVFGYRTNSDGINICGCTNVTVSDSFCRNGDDCFSVKTTNEAYESKNITFRNCIGWSNKARCFGITGEVCRDISDVTFEDSAVIYRNATWNNDRVSSLAIMNETGGKNIKNVTFKNIEIHHDSGRPIIVMITDPEIQNCTIEGVLFENITCNGDVISRIASKSNLSWFEKLMGRINVFLVKNNLTDNILFAKLSQYICEKFTGTNNIDVSFNNVTINEEPINLKKHFSIEGNAFTNVT